MKPAPEARDDWTLRPGDLPPERFLAEEPRLCGLADNAAYRLALYRTRRRGRPDLREPVLGELRLRDILELDSAAFSAEDHVVALWGRALHSFSLIERRPRVARVVLAVLAVAYVALALSGAAGELVFMIAFVAMGVGFGAGAAHAGRSAPASSALRAVRDTARSAAFEAGWRSPEPARRERGGRGCAIAAVGLGLFVSIPYAESRPWLLLLPPILAAWLASRVVAEIVRETPERSEEWFRDAVEAVDGLLRKLREAEERRAEPGGKRRGIFSGRAAD